MATLWTFIAIGTVIYLFWLNRKVAEAANSHAARQAEQLQVQLMSVACTKRRFGILKNGKPGIKSEFMFEFSSDGENAYQGILIMENEMLKSVVVPPHKI
ncbi:MULTISPECIES: DUF3301 domain-containing protein [unclassified Pseudoalteromonas]|jgi:hypothetical protein|uniref:DUF3301 domain-containing protein n=1 Tax=unclassified Pseudoalteromonas TaxID=194690 RepID=UPI000B7461F8|nr:MULTISPECIES: DUF3301 domain-containing protein [unclassified Pseudoalteromonas]MAJ41120.1 hypothetical protein [Pseudoalteromonadaceae bacterium]OUX84319.1 MAG: hypothetical protein CBC03_14310 [Pseudoalteromonas sp. TMED43]MDC9566869.1 DUF3301 domain-containing protein [Pseudoalteromonas sp. GAB2316C]MDC9571111.1 DUF3301 domain-containing protein [Pseudoalteromonas sp. GABNB9D]MDC9575301.1 DUF3301 domain-containing protein [Pseudoalteromonas sp. GABNS16A]